MDFVRLTPGAQYAEAVKISMSLFFIRKCTIFFRQIEVSFLVHLHAVMLWQTI